MEELTKLQTCICDIKAVIRCSKETHTKIVLEEVVENLEAVALEGQVQEQQIKNLAVDYIVSGVLAISKKGM